IPVFWIATLVLVLGAVWLSWAPPLEHRGLLRDPAVNLHVLAAPTIILGVNLSGTMLRVIRNEMLDVLRQEYIRTARAKGLASSTVLLRHALRNVLIPVVTIVGLQVPVLLSGSVILEHIFNIPGMGAYLIESLNQ